ncbi:MAG TPA: response regulator [Planctomycetota bacterium]|nr:response regulator [Planctomycetota bacterium]
MNPTLVLVIDDSATVRNEVATALAGFELLQATNGREGAELIEGRADIALAICDINMPEMTGIELLERIEGRAANPELKILMLTTEGQPSIIKRARQLGAKGWIVKPFNAQQLLAAARKLTAT